MRKTADVKKGKRLVCLTAYTAPVARLADQVADVVLVGDSLGMVLYGFPNTVPVTMQMMIQHGRAVAESCNKALVVIDMPFGSYQESPKRAFRAASRLLKQTRGQAVKLEGGAEMSETISFLVGRGVPVLGHVGMLPQHANAFGHAKVRDAERVLGDAKAIEKAGAFAVVLECVTAEIAEAVTKVLSIPVIGIGCGHPCDGQIAVTEDLLGLSEKQPSFSVPLTNLTEEAVKALSGYAESIRS